MMMGNFWLREASMCLVLLTLTGALWNLPFVKGETCNTHLNIRPVVDISSSPENNRLPIGVSITLTCTAEPRTIDRGYHDRWVNYIEWYDPQNKETGAKCLQPSNRRAHKLKLSCPLVLKNLTVDKFGRYTCQAGNGYRNHCTRKSFEIVIQDAQKPEIVEGPKNQSVLIGSNASLSCTARGLPRPTIHWIKDNASYPLQSNPRARVIPDGRANRSQLLITRVEMEDYGKYQCIANSSIGRSQSGVAVLKKVTPTHTPVNRKPENSASQTTIVAVSCTLVAAVICVVTGFVWNRRKNRDKEGRKRATKLYLKEGQKLKNGVQNLENNRSPNSQTIEIPAERLPLVGDGVGDRLPPDGSEWDDLVQGMKERSQERLESSEGIAGGDISTTDKHLGVDEQRDCGEISQETEEGSINLENLEVFDEILGEGEFGIVYKGRYSGKDGNITDVAVKKLKDPSAIAKETLLNEIRTLKQAGKHPNIVTLIGTRIEGGNVLVVTELIHGGSLENLLRAPGERNNYHNVCCKLNDRQLVTIAFQIAMGMQHLEERKQCVQESRIALAIYIPYPILMKWHELVGIKDERGNELNYIDLLNFWIPGRWFKVSKENGSRIHGRLRREAGAVVNKYTGKKVSGSKREEANRKGLTLNIYETELVVPHEIEENLSAAEQEIKEWKLRYKDLEKEKESLARGMMEAIRRKENEMGETVKTTEEKFRDIEEKNKELSEYIQNLEKKTGFLCQGKTIDSLGKRQQSRRLKELKEKSEIALWFLESHGLKLSFLKVQEAATNEFHTLEFDQLSANETDQNNLETLLFLLDKFCASDELYHELSLLSEDLPRTYLIKQRRNELNKLCHIERTPGQYPGAQLSFSETLQDHIKQFLESNSNHKGDEPIKVKISCDGAKMSRSANFMIMSFSLLQTGDLVMSSKGNRTIGVVNGPEKYETIETSFSEIINDINSVNKNGKIKVNDKEIAVELFLGGDYKFLLMAMGMSGATSDYACLWCKVHKLFRWDMSKDLSHYNEELKRTLQEIKELSSSSKKFSCVKSPLFTIELDHIILDELHLMLRVTDKLTENLITEVMEKDAKQDFNMARGKEKGVNLDILIKTINELGITFSLWEKKNADGKGSGTYDWTSLVGSDKKKLTKLLPAKLEELDILFPETKETVIKLWKDFYTLYSLINSDSNAGDFYLDIFQKSKDFVNLFCSLGGVRIGYEKKRVTPYMHALVYHVPMFIKNHKNFRQFTGQGIEKNNDDAKKIYFQKSNKWDAAQDVLLLEHRQEALKHCEREKRQYTKRKAAYWEDGIIETRKKRKRACLRELQNDHNGADVQGNNLSEDKYNKMTVKQLRQEIKSIGINVKGIAKLKKCQLVEILKQNQ